MSFLADPRVVRGYVALGAAAVLSYHWLHDDALYVAIALYCLAGAIGGALRMPPGTRRPWLVLAGAIGLWMAGDITFGIETVLGRHPVPPRISDAFYLVAYPLVAFALVLLVRQVGRRDPGATVDALIVALAAATALWPLLFATIIDGSGLGLGGRLISGVYPCWDVVFVALAARLALTRTLQTGPTLLLLSALTLFLAGDLVWFGAPGAYAVGGWMDQLWLAGYFCIGTAALHPRAAAPSGRDDLGSERRFRFLAIPVALLPAAMVAEVASGRSFSVVDGLLLSTVLLLLLGRLGTVVRGLEQTRRELREQNRLKDELISVVSHDLRTPLTSIMGYLELALDEETATEDTRDFLEVVRRNTERLYRLVEDLLFVSRAQAGRTVLDLATVDLAGLVRDAVAAAQPAASSADVELSCAVDPSATLVADAHRLSEVLENLLSNALKFTPPGGSVRVSLGGGADALVVRVSDTGVGIAEDDIGHLFDRFFRANGTDGIPGAGLGLAIVKAIVDAHEGRIDVRSTVGAGTTFEVRLPRRIAVSAPEPALAA